MTQESQGEGGEAIPGRRADDVMPEMIERALRELTEIVRARLPERFYRGEGHLAADGLAANRHGAARARPPVQVA